MRLILLPTSHSTLIFCQRLAAPPVKKKPRWDDRIAHKAEAYWTKMGQSPATWKQLVVRWGNRMLDTVSIEESGLRSIPPLNQFFRKVRLHKSSDHVQHIAPAEAINAKLSASALEPIPLVFPSTLKYEEALDRGRTVAEKGLKNHKYYMVLCAIGLPFTIPIALIPLVPNIPGIYLLYRLWANWKAYEGAKHLKYLVNGHTLPQNLPALDYAYSISENHVQRAERLDRIFLDKRLHHLICKLLRTMESAECSKK